jgi:pimeloyl-ACP methyl ester carboxylesterase
VPFDFAPPEPIDAPEPERRRRWPRILLWTLVPLPLLTMIAASAVGWYYSDEVLTVTRSDHDYPIEVVEVRDDVIVIDGEDADNPQVNGLEWDGGYARLHAGAERVDDGVLREYEPFPDIPAEGTSARLDFYAAPDDLARISDMDVAEVTFDGELGDLSATHVPGDLERWVIFVHGRGATQAETFRLLPTVAELGYPAMAISYRNDVGAPAAPDGRWGLGWTEAADVTAAVDYAISEGAGDVVLVGYSMGGAIIGNYMRTEGDAHVAGIVYDSPVLSWTDTLNYEAANRGLPALLTPLASAAIRIRAGIDLGALDQVRNADDLTVPVLLIHGTADDTVPVTSSDAFAEARPDLVTYVRPEGAGHVQSWNTHQRIYEDAVITFLTDLPASE